MDQINSTPASEAEAAFEETKTKKQLNTTMIGLKRAWMKSKRAEADLQRAQICFQRGKNDPKIKQFGEDVKSAFEKIGDDITDVFKKDNSKNGTDTVRSVHSSWA